MSIDDVDVARLLATPALVGGKSIWVSDQCVRRHRARRRSSRQPWQVRLLLRQLLETGRYRRSPPAWVPADIAVFDGYVELKDGQSWSGSRGTRMSHGRSAPSPGLSAPASTGTCCPDDAAPRVARSASS